MKVKRRVKRVIQRARTKTRFATGMRMRDSPYWVTWVEGVDTKRGKRVVTVNAEQAVRVMRKSMGTKKIKERKARNFKATIIV